MRKYYIVEHRDGENDPKWEAHKSGFWTMFGVFNILNYIANTQTHSGYGGSADATEKKLRDYLESKNFKAKVIRVVNI